MNRPAWYTRTVDAIIAGIVEEKAYDRLPVLADSLEDAGFGDGSHPSWRGRHIELVKMMRQTLQVTKPPEMNFVQKIFRSVFGNIVDTSDAAMARRKFHFDQMKAVRQIEAWRERYGYKEL